EFTLPQLRILAALLPIGLAIGCKAQKAQPSAADPVLNRRIEIQVRNQYSLPADVDVKIGARTPSQFTGYDTLPVTLSHNARTQVINFLVSADGTKLVQMNSFDLTKDPADTV